MKRILKFAVAMALAMALALPLAAQDSKVYREGNSWVEELTGTLAAARGVRVNTDMGSINLEGGSQKDVTYTIRKRAYTSDEASARRQFAAYRVSAAKHGDLAAFEGSAERGNVRRFSVEFRIQAPRDIESAKASTGGGSISIRNIAGRVDTDSGGGSVSLYDLSGPVSAETGGGSVEVSHSTNTLNLRTGGGSIHVSGSKGKVIATSGGGSIHVEGSDEAVTVETGGGSVEVQHCGAELRVSTGGGSIEIGDANGKVMLDTGGGSIHLASAKGMVSANTGGGTIELFKLMQGARAETGAGSITAEFLGLGQDSQLQTSVGDVVIYVSPQAKMTIKASLQMAGGHKIRSDFSEVKISSEGGEWGPKNYYAEGSLNGGGPVLRVRTMSGNIEIRRAR